MPLIIFILLFALPARAADYIDGKAFVDIPIRTKIVNLSAMPTDEALRFCHDRGLYCPAIEARAAAEGYTDQGQALQGDGWVSATEGQWVGE